MLQMPEKPVIINNSPLVALWQLGHLALLRELYTKVLIPEEVEEEFLRKNRDIRKAALHDATWLEIVPLAMPLDDSDYQELDRGEAAVLALAEERDARLVIFDDLDARQHARHLRLNITGTLGVLVAAKQKGLIDVIEPLLMQLRDNGMYLADAIINDALQQAGEID